jgi:hypothetical protein
VRAALLALGVLGVCGATASAAPLATQGDSSGLTVLSRVDPLTLAPRGPRIEFPEYHGSWSYSPGGRRLVLGTSAGGPAAGRGMHIIDVATLRELSTIQAPSAVEALAWLTRRRIAGAWQGGVFVADPVLGRVLVHRGAPSRCGVTPQTGLARGKLVLLLDHVVMTAGADQRLRTARLRGLADRCNGGTVVVDGARGRAFTVGTGHAVGEVRLRGMRVKRHRLAGPRARGDATEAIWLDHHGLIAAAHYFHSRSIPAGVESIDTRTWTRRLIDARAGNVVKAGRTLLLYGGPNGLRVHGLGGRPLWSVLRRQTITNVQVAGRYAYAIGTRVVSIVDLRRHRVVHRSRPAPNGIEFLTR